MKLIIDIRVLHIEEEIVKQNRTAAENVAPNPFNTLVVHTTTSNKASPSRASQGVLEHKH